MRNHNDVILAQVAKNGGVVRVKMSYEELSLCSELLSLRCINLLQCGATKIEIFIDKPAETERVKGGALEHRRREYLNRIKLFGEFIFGFSDGEYHCEENEVEIGDNDFNYTKISIMNSMKKE